jgi:hypothetical protein
MEDQPTRRIDALFAGFFGAAIGLLLAAFI